MSQWLLVLAICLAGIAILTGYILRVSLATRRRAAVTAAAELLLLPPPLPLPAMLPATTQVVPRLPPPIPPPRPPRVAAVRAQHPVIEVVAAPTDEFSDDHAETTIAASYDASRRVGRELFGGEATRPAKRYTGKRELVSVHQATTAVRPVTAYRVTRKPAGAA